MTTSPATPPPAAAVSSKNGSQATPAKPGQGGAAPATVEIGGPKGPEPTRYGDWERNGRCSDF